MNKNKVFLTIPIIFLVLISAFLWFKNSQKYFGKLTIDEKTELVFLHEPSAIGGECEGWSAMSIQEKRKPETGIKSILCWKKAAGYIYTASKTRVFEERRPANVLN